MLPKLDKKLGKSNEEGSIHLKLDSEDMQKLDAVMKKYNYKTRTSYVRDLIRSYYSQEFDSKN